jgi:Flp pilus assembly secretin CpaC/tetratricopeptide (TPR) repeat protein
MQTSPQARETRISKTHPPLGRWTKFCACALLAMFSIGIQAQTDHPTAQSSPPGPSSTADQTSNALPAIPVRNSDRRKAAKLYLASSKLFVGEQFEEAMRGYEQAAALDPGTANYQLAASVARSHAVTALIQAAAKDRLRGDEAGARAILAHALELEPKNIQVAQHLYELGDDALLGQPRPAYEQAESTIDTAIKLEPTVGVHSFHLHTDQRQIIPQIFKAYGIDATEDSTVGVTHIRLDLDDVDFETATRVVGMATATFYIPLDAHHVLVARDSRENRQQFTPMEYETVYLPGLSATELTDVINLAKNVFNVQQAVAEPTSGTITIRASQKTMNVFNATMRELLDGRNQVLLEVRMIQLAHTNARNTGVQPPASMGIFNVAAEAESVFNANQSLIQQIISSGLAAPGDYMAILGILLASGQVTNPLLTNGIATFGGSLTNCTNGIYSCKGTLTTYGLSPGTATANLNLNSSDSRELDQIQLRLGDGEAATIKTGTKYPIQTSSYSSLGSSVASIPGLTGAGASGSLSSLLASYAGSVPNVPMVQYQDLGLTLKATPKVLRNDDVALTIDMKIDALAGTYVNGNPVLNNRSWSGVVTLKQGEAVEVISELDKSESRAVSGTPGISEIPGLNSLTDKDTQKNYATLLIVITPHVIRGTQAAGHSPMMRVERGATP